MPIYSNLEGPTLLPGKLAYDANNKRMYYAKYRPDVWVANKEVIQDVDVVIPNPPNGCKYVAVSGGRTGVDQPTFLTVNKETTKDNDVLWKCLPYDLELKTGDTISLSNWLPQNGEEVDSVALVSGEVTKFRLISVPVGAKKATIVNRITITRANGDVDEDIDSTFIIPVKEL